MCRRHLKPPFYDRYDSPRALPAFQERVLSLPLSPPWRLRAPDGERGPVSTLRPLSNARSVELSPALHQCDDDDQTPLHVATSTCPSHTSLINCGANPDMKSEGQEVRLHQENGRVLPES